MDDYAEGPSTLPHGRKRPANDSLESDQRLAKRLNLLNLNQSGKYYIPVTQDVSQHPARAEDGTDSMQLDNTKEKVYIYNLDQELADVESDEEKLIFLPDIEKKLGKVPQSVLTTQSQPVTSNEMILYNVPSSLSVPREQDKVRKAIIETRARARDKQEHDLKDLASQNMSAPDIANGVRPDEHYSRHTDWDAMNDDENAMDIG
ncbi:hypothetical protein MMC29_003677 [Sticta canariensis]|nr:hypothetical protein [Sticta canariensis]